MSLPGSIGVPHQGQLVSWCGRAAPPAPPPQPLPWSRLMASAACSVQFGRAALPDPQADAERLVAPRRRRRPRRRIDLAGADQRRGPLELLERQQAQGVAHEHRHAGVAAIGRRPSPCRRRMRHRVGGHAQVGLGLAAAGREPQQVGDQPVSDRCAPGGSDRPRPGQVEEHEGELERIPLTGSSERRSRRAAEPRCARRGARPGHGSSGPAAAPSPRWRTRTRDTPAHPRRGARFPLDPPSRVPTCTSASFAAGSCPASRAAGSSTRPSSSSIQSPYAETRGESMAETSA